MKNKPFLESFLIALFLISGKSLSQIDSIPVRIDAFNWFMLSPSDILPNSNLSITSGSPHDSFFVMPAYSDHLLSITADIGAESGEALLNRYSKPGFYQNRDHRSSFSMLMSIPKTPLSLVYKYLYVDEYSNRFDSLWINYNKITGTSMKYDEDGLRHEHLAIASYKKENFLMQTNYNWYRRWNTTPYFFSPILSYGYSVNPSVSYSTDAISILSNWLINKHSEYYDHLTPDDFTDVSFLNKLSVKISKELNANINVQYDPLTNPGSFFSVGLSHYKSPFHWDLTGLVYSNYENSVSGYGSYHFTPNINCSLHVSRAYLPQTRPYYFKENKTHVSYDPISTKQTNLYSSANYTDTLIIPFSLNTWFQYNSNPIWESINFINDSIFIRQVPYKNSESVLGINGHCLLNIKSVHLSCNPSIIFPTGNTISRFSIKKMVDINLSYSPSDSNSISASVTLQYRDRSCLNYLVSDYNEPMQSFLSPAQTSLYIHVLIPFIVPFINSQVKNTALFVNAGPIRLSKIQRILEHPKGNLIGPAIYTGIKGTIW